MPEKKFVRYAMFGSLYFTQGTILSFFTALNALYLKSYGISMTDIGIFGLIAILPFVIKVFLGMLSDKKNLFNMGHRKPYILIGLAIQTICLLIVPLIDPAKYYWAYVAVAFILQTGMALYDTCTDGLALDTIPEDEQGTIQTFMVGGRAVGLIAVSFLVGFLAQKASWTAVFLLLAAFTLIPVPMVLKLRETERPVERTFDWKAFAAFKQKTVIALAALGFVFFLIIAGANQNVNPYLQDKFNISYIQAGSITGVWGIGVLLGSVVGGQLIQRVGRKRATWSAIFLSVVGILPLAFIPSAGFAWLLVPLFGLSYGTYQTVYFALAMGYTDSRIAASMFSIIMAVTNIAQGVGMALSGRMADSSFGYAGAFIVLALLNVLAIPIIPVLFGKRAKTQTTAA